MRELISQTFKYTDEVLASGATVKTAEFTVKDGKLANSNGVIKAFIGDEINVEYNFSVYSRFDNELIININNAPIDIDAMGYVREFISHVEE